MNSNQQPRQQHQSVRLWSHSHYGRVNLPMLRLLLTIAREPK